MITNLSGVIKQLKTQELEARHYMISKYKVSLEDRVWRALGILKTARLITSNETLGCLSFLRLGMDLDIIKGLDRELLNNLFILIQPEHIQKI